MDAAGREPDPAEAAAIADECKRLLELLSDERLRAVAVWKLEGYTNHEIGEKIGLKEKTVERKLQLIRRMWEQEVDVQ